MAGTGGGADYPLAVIESDGRRTIYLTNGGDIRTIDGQPYRTIKLSDAAALGHPRPGDVIQLLPGKYWAPLKPDDDGAPDPQAIRLEGLRGTPDNPITLRGLGVDTILCGSNAAVPIYPELPQDKHYAFLKLIDCEGIVVEDVAVESCWPCFVYVQDSRFITVRRITGVDGVYLVFARGQSTHHLAVEDCDWEQDPSGAVWDEIYWEETHHGAYAYLNGGLFGSEDITGHVVIRNNRIHNAYNGVRMKAKSADAPGRLNLNVEISGNRFERVRDNPVEPEGTATNWWVHGNEIHNAYAWFSFDGVGGGLWAVFGNRGWFDDKPGQPSDPNTAGRVIKYDEEPPYPDRPVQVFNNSWYLRSNVVKNGNTRQLRHRNNAVEFCAAADLPKGVCNPKRALVGDDFMEAGWSADVVFDFDLNNRAFPSVLTGNGQERNGTFDPAFRFRDGPGGDLTSATRAPGTVIDLTREDGWGLDWFSGPVEAGAFQGADQIPFIGPPFAAVGDLSAVPPHVTRVDRMAGPEGGWIWVHFSVPMERVEHTAVRLRLPDGTLATAPARVEDTRLEIQSPVPPDAVVVLLPRPLVSASGVPATLWASADEGVEWEDE